MAARARRTTLREKPAMANQPHSAGRHVDDVPPPVDDIDEEPIPAMQQLLDNPFLLLFAGVALPTVLYIIWGVMEIVVIPVAK
jgi:hypothetical protein